MARILNLLTDPDVAAVRARMPTDPGNILPLVSQLSNFILDNTSSLRADLADLLCGLATGAAESARRLYSNGERSLSSALCSVIFTSVLDAGITGRPDLQDRMLVINTRPLPKSSLRSEAELKAAWEADLPHLLADLFDLLVVGLRNIGLVRAAQKLGVMPPPPRFADAAQAAEAAAWHGLGWPAGLLTNALHATRSAAATDQLSNNPYAYRIRMLLARQPGGIWRGNNDDLKQQLHFLDGPAWDHRTSFGSGLARAKGPMRNHWGIESKEVGSRKRARTFEWRVSPDVAAEPDPGDGQ